MIDGKNATTYQRFPPKRTVQKERVSASCCFYPVFARPFITQHDDPTPLFLGTWPNGNETVPRVNQKLHGTMV